jgi:predicted dithiol-disulfide oxidoreductase (DUF899 family)
MAKREIVSEAEWIEARRALLAEEKAWTRERDRLSQKRRALPWVKVVKNYVFEGVEGPVALADLFDGRSQLVVYHFMFGPEWEEGCPGCSLLSDQVDGARRHFEHNDVSFVAVSRGPIAKLQAYRKRMGWKFRWVSSAVGDFNFDYHVSFPNGTHKQGVYNNFEERPIPGWTSSLVSASSTRTAMERFTIPILPTAAAVRCSCRSMAGSMSSPKGATRPRTATSPTG